MYMWSNSRKKWRLQASHSCLRNTLKRVYKYNCSSVYKGKENVMRIKLILKEREHTRKSSPGNARGQILLFLGLHGEITKTVTVVDISNHRTPGFYRTA